MEIGIVKTCHREGCHLVFCVGSRHPVIDLTGYRLVALAEICEALGRCLIRCEFIQIGLILLRSFSSIQRTVAAEHCRISHTQDIGRNKAADIRGVGHITSAGGQHEPGAGLAGEHEGLSRNQASVKFNFGYFYAIHTFGLCEDEAKFGDGAFYLDDGNKFLHLIVRDALNVFEKSEVNTRSEGGS